ncbi:MAG: M23 family metallopeptidase [Pseudobdellovibrionaceae bacterium]
MGHIFILLSLANLSFAETVRYVLNGQENIRRLEQSRDPVLQLVASLPKGTVIEVDVDDVKKQKEAVRRNEPGSNYFYVTPGGGKQKSVNGWTRGVKVISVPDEYKDSVSPELINKNNLFFSINSLETLTVREGSNSSGREMRRTTSSIPGLAPTPTAWASASASASATPTEPAAPSTRAKRPARGRSTQRSTGRTVTTGPATPPPATPHEAVAALDEAGRVVKKLNKPYDNQECGYVRISSKYGHRHASPGVEAGHHDGIDVVMKHGGAIRSAATGRVLNITPTSRSGGFGNIIEIEHGEYIGGKWHGMGLKTRYAHLSGFAPSLKVGDKVASGELVGRAGSTGKSTGTHLHFEVYEQTPRGGWATVNPTKYVNF